MTCPGRRSAAPQHHPPPDRRQAPDYVPPPAAPVSWDAFLAWLDEDVRAEWVDKRIVEMPPVRDDHQFILGFLYRLMMSIVEDGRLGTVFLAPFLMRLTERPSGREPDLIFVSSEHTERLTPTYLDGPADLVVEIVSPESAARDYHEKRAEYEAAGIPEYWVIDPVEQCAIFYQLGDDGAYHSAPVDANGIYASRVVPGLRLRVAWLWQRPLPPLAAALTDLPA